MVFTLFGVVFFLTPVTGRYGALRGVTGWALRGVTGRYRPFTGPVQISSSPPHPNQDMLSCVGMGWIQPAIWMLGVAGLYRLVLAGVDETKWV